MTDHFFPIFRFFETHEDFSNICIECSKDTDATSINKFKAMVSSILYRSNVKHDSKIGQPRFSNDLFGEFLFCLLFSPNSRGLIDRTVEV